MSVTEAQLAAWEAMTDEELCALVRQGVYGAEEVLVKRYTRFVRKLARPFYLAGGDSDDLIQEGMIGLFKAIRDYDCGRDASFYTFADLCISRQMYTAVQASHRQKHWPLNTYVSLYGSGRSQEDSEEMELAEALSPDQDQNPETLFIDRERVEYLEGQIDRELSSFEKQVLDLYLTGMSYSQIAKVLGREEKSTDNALQRLKSKIKKML